MLLLLEEYISGDSFPKGADETARHKGRHENNESLLSFLLNVAFGEFLALPTHWQHSPSPPGSWVLQSVSQSRVFNKEQCIKRLLWMSVVGTEW
jgi:hypothetical protein